MHLRSSPRKYAALSLLVGVSVMGVRTWSGAGSPHGGHAGMASLVTVTPTQVVTHMDKFPRFCANPTVTSMRTGSWADPATWSTGAVPQAGDKVSIADGHAVLFNASSTPALSCIEIGGALNFSLSQDTSLTARTIMVLPQGSLFIGSAANPLPSQFRAEIIIPDVPLDTGIDPAQLGNGIIGFGTVRMHGAVKNLTFVRLATEPRAGDTTLQLSSSVSGWQPGDKLFLPDTRQLPLSNFSHDNPHWEELTVSSVNGSTVTLASRLQFDHLAAHEPDGSVVIAPDGHRLLPHVANLSRNILIRSASPDGTRGHVLFTMRADIDVRYSEFRDLGRTRAGELDSTTVTASGVPTHIGTNQIGRYGLHMHHLVGPENPGNTGYQFRLIGNAVTGYTGPGTGADRASKWGIVVHASHYGHIKDNVAYRNVGANFMVEDGSEWENLFERNMAIRSPGVRGFFGTVSLGNEGAGIWSRGAGSLYRDNVMANNYENGYFQFAIADQGYFFNTRIPTRRGADMEVASEYKTAPEVFYFRDFVRNESYGAQLHGFQFWSTNGGQSLIQDATAWHVSLKGVHVNYGGPMNFDRLLVADDSSRVNDGSFGIFTWNAFGGHFGSENVLFTVQRSALKGVTTGIQMEHPVNSCGVLFDKNIIYAVQGINFTTKDNNSRRCHAHLSTVRDVTFLPVPGFPLKTVRLTWIPSGHSAPANPDRFDIENYNGTGQNYRLYYQEQHPDAVMIPFGVHAYQSGCPKEGMTNAQCWAEFGLATGGSLPPCLTRHSEMDGAFACPPSMQPQSPTGSRKVIFTKNALTLVSPREVSAAWIVTGSTYYTDAARTVVQLDALPAFSWGLAFHSEWKNVQDGQHVIRGHLERQDGSKIEGSDDQMSFALQNGQIVFSSASSQSSSSSSVTIPISSSPLVFPLGPAPASSSAAAFPYLPSSYILPGPQKAFPAYDQILAAPTASFSRADVSCEDLSHPVAMDAADPGMILRVGTQFFLLRDVDVPSWYDRFVARAVIWGLASGYRTAQGQLTGFFGPQNKVTYAELAKMTLALAGRSADVMQTSNLSARGTWASPYIGAAEHYGLSLYQNPSLRVHAPATRADAIQTILEALAVPPDPAAPQPFTDIPATHPRLLAIKTAAAWGLIEGDRDSQGQLLRRFRPDAPIDRAAISKLLVRAKELSCQ